ncbi:MAG TPA: hypothetical protein VFN35_12830 [Ktedonobacteraceae bacterium]|nr:hypothetical protein [Ktedonobacteraceae bacterium]
MPAPCIPGPLTAYRGVTLHPHPPTCVLFAWESTLLQQPCNARRALLDVRWRSLELVASQSRKSPLLVDLQFESLKAVAIDCSCWEAAC